MSRWLSGQQCSFCKHKDLSFNSQHSHKIPGMAVWICKPSTGRQRQADPERSLARQPSRNSKLRVRVRLCLKGVKPSARLLIPSALLWASHAQAGSHTHTLMCIQSMCAHTGQWGKTVLFMTSLAKRNSLKMQILSMLQGWGVSCAEAT